MQICHCCTPKDQVHLINISSATALAHHLSRHAGMAATILWQPMTPCMNPSNRCMAA